jgi:hypothetical protein
MRYVGESKIGKLHPRRSKIYPMVRLPTECLNIIRETAHIYVIEQKGARGLFIALGPEANDRNVAQLPGHVAQPKTQNDIRSRLSALESEIKELKSLLLSKKAISYNENRKPKAEGEIRTRVVASTGPLTLLTAQMCHKTSFDLSRRTG